MKAAAMCLSGFPRWLRVTLLCTLAALPQLQTQAQAQDAATLRSHYTRLREQLTHNQFQRPLYLESDEASGELSGNIYALLEQPYAEVGPALQGTDHWCDILILHLNVKSCRTSTAKADDRLSLSIGRKSDQPLDEAYPVEFRYERVTVSPDYLQLMLKAAEGPLGTSHYRIALEVVALDNERSFLHLSYAYAYGMAANVAMQGYLATIGRNKVGFSVVDHTDDGQPIYIGGMRGVVERNTMRYFLAIEAYLGALTTAPQERLEKRLNDWFTGIERYPRQLHELERDEYLDMKHKEIQRQQALESADQPN